MHSPLGGMHFPKKYCISLPGECSSQKNTAFPFRGNAVPKKTLRSPFGGMQFPKKYCVPLSGECSSQKNTAFPLTGGELPRSLLATSPRVVSRGLNVFSNDAR